MAHILAVEDDDLFGDAVCDILQADGHTAERAISLAQARDRVSDQQFDLVLLDISLPDGHGPTLIPDLREAGIPRVICLTAHAGVPAVVDAMRAGAYDYIEKGQPPAELLARVREALPRRTVTEEHAVLARSLLGSSSSMREVRRMTKLASQTSTTVLIHGETGTGKSHIARLIHQLSNRGARPFVTVDCAALSESLAESQLFGHERGAFTGAVNRHVGVLETAAEGTLFFDEIADLPMSVQGKLLRALEDRIFTRVGSGQELPIRARILGATRRDLSEMVAAGEFREDLYFRLTVLEIRLPALRDRTEDIPDLLEHFLQQTEGPLAGKPTQELLNGLLAHTYPGNVRELRNLAERIQLLSKMHGTTPTFDELGLRLSQPRVQRNDIEPRTPQAEDGDVEIGQALVASGGRIGEAARALGISRHALRRRLKKSQVRPDGTELANSGR